MSLARGGKNNDRQGCVQIPVLQCLQVLEYTRLTGPVHPGVHQSHPGRMMLGTCTHTVGQHPQ